MINEDFEYEAFLPLSIEGSVEMALFILANDFVLDFKSRGNFISLEMLLEVGPVLRVILILWEFRQLNVVACGRNSKDMSRIILLIELSQILEATD